MAQSVTLARPVRKTVFVGRKYFIKSEITELLSCVPASSLVTHLTDILCFVESPVDVPWVAVRSVVVPDATRGVPVAYRIIITSARKYTSQ